MRPVVLQMGGTLDRFVHGAKGDEDWGLPAEEDDVVEWKATSLRKPAPTSWGVPPIRTWLRCRRRAPASTRT